MQRNSLKTIGLIGFAAMGLAAFGQDPAQPPATPQQQTPAGRQAMAARREATQRLATDFSNAVKNGSLSAEDQQKAQAALAQLGPHTKGALRDPQARREAMGVVRQLSASTALRPEDRDLLAKDLAALKAMHPQRN
jgi:hypothetical protein